MKEYKAKNSTDNCELQGEGMPSTAIKIYYEIIVI